jgi:site-specific recombinase XerD
MEEVPAILNAPNLTTRLGIRDRAMLHLCFAAGLGVGLLLENISLQPTPSIRVLGKERKERPSALEGNYFRPPRLAGSTGIGPRTRVVRQC